MTQEEEAWVHQHLSSEELDIYQRGQVQFYERLLALWRVSQTACTPKTQATAPPGIWPP